jgi:4-amino-4-deoxy-L-arabinose transferase-like glycosyltransferase
LSEAKLPLDAVARPTPLTQPQLGTALVLLALAVRLPGLAQQSLWTDEVLTTGAIALPWPEMYRRLLLGGETHPVLYHSLARLWCELIGYSKVHARLFSVAAGVLFVVATWRLAARLVGERVALIAAVLAALSPYALYFSQEVRSYMLFALFTTASYHYYFSYVDHRRPRTAAAWVALQILAFYTHVYAVFALAAQGLHLLARRRPWKELKAPLACFAGIGLACIPWGLVIVFVKTRYLVGASPLGYQEPVGFGHIAYVGFALLYGYSLGPSVEELHTLHGLRAVAGAHGPTLLFAMAAALPLIALGARRVWRDPAARLAVGLGLATPVALSLLVSTFSKLAFNVRFVIAALPFLLMVIAAGLDELRGQARLLAVPYALAVGLALFNSHTQPKYFREDYERAAEVLRTRPSVPVLAGATPGMHRFFAPELDPRPLTAEALDRVPRGEARWLVWNRPWAFDPRGALRTKVDAEFRVVSEQRLTGFVVQLAEKK